jgi:hypothetical protein
MCDPPVSMVFIRVNTLRPGDVPPDAAIELFDQPGWQSLPGVGNQIVFGEYATYVTPTQIGGSRLRT